MFEGLLVDLVPYGNAFQQQEHRWLNNESAFWGMAGDRLIVSRAAVERWQTERQDDGARPDGGSIWFGIRSKAGVPLGDIELGYISPHHRMSMIGVGIGEPEYWGGGYGTDALLLIMEYAFNWLDHHRLWLHTMGTNVRMQRAATKVGFHEEARRRRFWLADGQWTDDVIYGLLRQDWPGRETLVERLGLHPRQEP